MHPLGRISLASHALPLAALFAPAPAWPFLAGWGAVQGAVMWELLRPASTRLAPNVRRAATEGRSIALTFDDGPRDGETQRLLDALGEARDAKATFFLVGRRARSHGSIVRRIARDGHTIGNHTHTHPLHWSVATRKRVDAEVGDAQKAIADAAGVEPRWFRPPVGHKNFHLAEALERHGLAQVTWSIRSFDTLLRDPRQVVGRVVSRAAGGDIVLMHEGLAGRDRTPLSVLIVPDLLDGLRRKGLAPVSLQALLSSLPSAAQGQADPPQPASDLDERLR
jgi:peptidoglycan/xylan/chitin deacetylase (PgdA/CDA1 family)